MNEHSEIAQDASNPRVGERLKAAREQQQLVLEDVAARTRIPTRHLRAIEEGNYQGLPAATYSAGFVKTYARLLGLDAPKLSDDFRGEMGLASVPHLSPASYEPADPRRTPPAGLALLAVFIALLAGLGYLYWRGSTDQPTELAAKGPAMPAAPTVAPAPSVGQPDGGGPVGTGAPSSSAPVVPANGGPVVISASEDVWIKISDSGKNLYMGTLKAGDRFQLPPEAAAPLLTTGRPGSTTITVGATPIPPVGDPDRAAKNVSLRAPDLLARLASPGAGQATPAAQLPANPARPG